ncbi:MAG: zinc ribbon domain-containing protein [Phycisphaerales bacterium]|nr:zinc ribbon domain-containing protein [Phycisphaerales bacterium]
MPASDSNTHDWKDPRTLLCERCGYVIENLDHALPCPECGKPIIESLPHRAQGSPWQNRRSIWSLLQTWFMTICRSKALFGRLNIDEEASSNSLLFLGLLLGFLTPMLTILTVSVISIVQYGRSTFPGFMPIFLTALVLLFFWIFAVIYASLGTLRLRYFAHIRKYRLTQATRSAIVGHASLGLTIAPIGITGAIFVFILLDTFDLFDRGPFWLGLSMAGSIIAWLSIPLALIEFEILMHTGSKALRYRNILPPEDNPNA